MQSNTEIIKLEVELLNKYIQAGDQKAILDLLSTREHLLNHQDPIDCDRTPLQKIIYQNAKDAENIAISLLDKFPHPKLDVDKASLNSIQALAAATMKKMHNLIEKLLPVSDLNVIGYLKQSAFLVACSVVNEKLINKMLEGGKLTPATINQGKEDKHPPLWYLVSPGTPSSLILKVLKHGADPLAIEVVSFVKDEKNENEKAQRDLIKPFIEYATLKKTFDEKDEKQQIALSDLESKIATLYQKENDEKTANEYKQKMLDRNHWSGFLTLAKMNLPQSPSIAIQHLEKVYFATYEDEKKKVAALTEALQILNEIIVKNDKEAKADHYATINYEARSLLFLITEKDYGLLIAAFNQLKQKPTDEKSLDWLEGTNGTNQYDFNKLVGLPDLFEKYQSQIVRGSNLAKKLLARHLRGNDTPFEKTRVFYLFTKLLKEVIQLFPKELELANQHLKQNEAKELVTILEQAGYGTCSINDYPQAISGLKKLNFPSASFIQGDTHMKAALSLPTLQDALDAYYQFYQSYPIETLVARLIGVSKKIPDEEAYVSIYIKCLIDCLEIHLNKKNYDTQLLFSIFSYPKVIKHLKNLPSLCEKLIKVLEGLYSEPSLQKMILDYYDSFKDIAKFKDAKTQLLIKYNVDAKAQPETISYLQNTQNHAAWKKSAELLEIQGELTQAETAYNTAVDLALKDYDFTFLNQLLANDKINSTIKTKLDTRIKKNGSYKHANNLTFTSLLFLLNFDKKAIDYWLNLYFQQKDEKSEPTIIDEEKSALEDIYDRAIINNGNANHALHQLEEKLANSIHLQKRYFNLLSIKVSRWSAHLIEGETTTLKPQDSKIFNEIIHSFLLSMAKVFDPVQHTKYLTVFEQQKKFLTEENQQLTALLNQRLRYVNSTKDSKDEKTILDLALNEYPEAIYTLFKKYFGDYSNNSRKGYSLCLALIYLLQKPMVKQAFPNETLETIQKDITTYLCNSSKYSDYLKFVQTLNNQNNDNKLIVSIRTSETKGSKNLFINIVTFLESESMGGVGYFRDPIASVLKKDEKELFPPKNLDAKALPITRPEIDKMASASAMSNHDETIRCLETLYATTTLLSDPELEIVNKILLKIISQQPKHFKAHLGLCILNNYNKSYKKELFNTSISVIQTVISEKDKLYQSIYSALKHFALTSNLELDSEIDINNNLYLEGLNQLRNVVHLPEARYLCLSSMNDFELVYAAQLLAQFPEYKTSEILTAPKNKTMLETMHFIYGWNGNINLPYAIRNLKEEMKKNKDPQFCLRASSLQACLYLKMSESKDSIVNALKNFNEAHRYSIESGRNTSLLPKRFAAIGKKINNPRDLATYIEVLIDCFNRTESPYYPAIQFFEIGLSAILLKQLSEDQIHSLLKTLEIAYQKYPKRKPAIISYLKHLEKSLPHYLLTIQETLACCVFGDDSVFATSSKEAIISEFKTLMSKIKNPQLLIKFAHLQFINLNIKDSINTYKQALALAGNNTLLKEQILNQYKQDHQFGDDKASSEFKSIENSLEMMSIKSLRAQVDKLKDLRLENLIALSSLKPKTSSEITIIENAIKDWTIEFAKSTVAEGWELKENFQIHNLYQDSITLNKESFAYAATQLEKKLEETDTENAAFRLFYLYQTKLTYLSLQLGMDTHFIIQQILEKISICLKTYDRRKFSEFLTGIKSHSNSNIQHHLKIINQRMDYYQARDSKEIAKIKCLAIEGCPEALLDLANQSTDNNTHDSIKMRSVALLLVLQIQLKNPIYQTFLPKKLITELESNATLIFNGKKFSSENFSPFTNCMKNILSSLNNGILMSLCKAPGFLNKELEPYQPSLSEYSNPFLIASIAIFEYISRNSQIKLVNGLMVRFGSAVEEALGKNLKELGKIPASTPLMMDAKETQAPRETLEGFTSTRDLDIPCIEGTPNTQNKSAASAPSAEVNSTLETANPSQLASDAIIATESTNYSSALIHFNNLYQALTTGINPFNIAGLEILIECLQEISSKQTHSQVTSLIRQFTLFKDSLTTQTQPITTSANTTLTAEFTRI